MLQDYKAASEFVCPQTLHEHASLSQTQGKKCWFTQAKNVKQEINTEVLCSTFANWEVPNGIDWYSKIKNKKRKEIGKHINLYGHIRSKYFNGNS